MNIKIYGTGCPKCKTLAANVAAALAEAGLAAEVEKVTDIDKIIARGIMTTPALEIDGEIVSAGRIMSADEIAHRISPTKAKPSCGCSCGNADTRTTKPLFRRIFGGLLLAFALCALAWSFAKDTQKSNSCCAGTFAVPATANAPSAKQEAQPLTVYYFHGTRRCMTCNKIEQLTRAAISASYKDEIESGKMIFKAVNVEQPENEHFIADFDLTTRSVVVQRGAKYERLDKVWQLVHGDEAAFRGYIADAIRRISGEQR